VPNGPHRLTLETVGNGETRLFGVALENGDRGVQYDSLGVNGAYIGLLANYIDPDHWSEQLRHRRPDLVIIGYGANESQFERLPMDQYERDTKEVIRRIRGALPGISILFIGPMDRGARGAGGSIITRPMIPRLISYQRRIAAETGCAFFDTFTAMGGEGTVDLWDKAKPKLMGGDLTHPTAQGAEIVGTLIYDALIDAYEKHKLRTTR
jgi:lysophospholipase L1-like esterase